MNQAFVDAIFAAFPDSKNTNMISIANAKVVGAQLGIKSRKKVVSLLGERITQGMYQVFNDATPIAAKPAQVVHQASPSIAPISEPISMIPAIDKNYVPFGNFKDLESIISSGLFYPTYVYGPTGNGKSTMVEQICAKHKRNLIRVNLNAMSDEEQLIGSKTLKDGNVEVIDGPVLIAMRTGSTLLLDEIDAASANSILSLQSILEGKPYYFKLKNELVVPAPGFNIIATANTKGKGSEDGRYIGTNVLNEAFLERFAVTFEQEYPPAKVELNIVMNLMNEFNCVDEEFANLLVTWANAIRKTFDNGGVDELITTRRMTHIIRAYSVFKNRTKAITLCCNRFDYSTKGAFIDLFAKISNSPDEVPEVA